MGPWPCSWEQASHRVSMTVLSCLMDFPVSDAPRNTAGDGLSDTLLQMNRNAVQESSARKRRASAMKPCEEPEAQLQGAQGSAWAPRVRSVGYCVAEHTDTRLRTSSKGAVLGKYLGSLENYNFSLVRKTAIASRGDARNPYLAASEGLGSLSPFRVTFSSCSQDVC